MTAAISRISVIVPAHDEEHLIGRCLRAIRRSADHLHSVAPARADIVVVLDRCLDETQLVARSHAVRILAIDAGSVGAARHAGVSDALTHNSIHPRQHWLATTDADSVVPPDWLSTHLELAAVGAEVVTGLVTPDHELPTLLRHRWAAAHPVRTGHDHVFGANLGIRGDLYRAIGGFPSVRTGEDRALVDAANAVGARITATDRGIVTTSSRRRARAPEGFAHWLYGPERRVPS